MVSGKRTGRGEGPRQRDEHPREGPPVPRRPRQGPALPGAGSQPGNGRQRCVHGWSGAGEPAGGRNQFEQLDVAGPRQRRRARAIAGRRSHEHERVVCRQRAAIQRGTVDHVVRQGDAAGTRSAEALQAGRLRLRVARRGGCRRRRRAAGWNQRRVHRSRARSRRVRTRSPDSPLRPTRAGGT